MCAALRREPHFDNHPPPIHEALANVGKRMCSALRREPHFENGPPSICETVANFEVPGWYVTRKSQAKSRIRPKKWPRGATERS
eukprot:5990454-Pyramimonas_sp.AAC.1